MASAAAQVGGGLEESSSMVMVPQCTSFDTASCHFLCNKKRKVDDTSFASPPASTCTSKQIENESSEDEEDQRPGSATTMAFDERLSTLQQLLPQGLELEEDEVLRVAIEYVKELEREIQMFHGSPEGCAKLEHSINDSPLQRRGLCIVPLSTLARSL